MEKRTKTLNYQLLHVYQTNCPTFCTQANFKRLFKESYARAIIRFSLDLQEIFGLAPLFNQPEKQAEQKAKIKEVFNSCFKEFLDEPNLFRETLKYLISGTVNFSYGFKLYSLFKKDELLELESKRLFISRIEATLLSQHYEKHPSQTTLDDKDTQNLEQALQTKLSRYKTFA